jgi:hypothetical protein
MCTGSHDYIPAEWVGEVRLNFSTVGGVAENVLNFKFPGIPSETDLSQLADDIEGWVTDLYSPCFNPGTALQNIVVTDLTTETGAQVTHLVDPPIAGTLSGDGLPDNVTLAVKHVTAKRGRSYRGRTYVPGLASSALADSDTITTDYQTLVGNAFEGLLATPFPGHGETFVIVSRCQDKAWLTDAVVTTVTGSAVDPDIDSMRRRLKGRGI